MAIKCDGCGLEVSKSKYLKKLNGGFYCKKCEQKKRKEHREFLRRQVMGIRKRSDLEKEWAEKRKQRELERQEKPIIPGGRIKQRQDRFSRNTHMYLTREERQFLFRKLIKFGFSEEECKDRVNSIIQYLKEYVERLREQKKQGQEISNRFNEEFLKLVNSYSR